MGHRDIETCYRCGGSAEGGVRRKDEILGEGEESVCTAGEKSLWGDEGRGSGEEGVGVNEAERDCP